MVESHRRCFNDSRSALKIKGRVARWDTEARMISEAPVLVKMTWYWGFALPAFLPERRWYEDSSSWNLSFLFLVIFQTCRFWKTRSAETCRLFLDDVQIVNRHPPSEEYLFANRKAAVQSDVSIWSCDSFVHFALNNICKTERFMLTVFCLKQQPWSRLQSQRRQHWQRRSDLRYDRIRWSLQRRFHRDGLHRVRLR